MKVLWVRRARRSLEAMADFIARDNPQAAFEMVLRLGEAANMLAKTPEMGRPGRVKGTRELVVPGTPYILPYRVTNESVQILHVLHAARRWPRNL